MRSATVRGAGSRAPWPAFWGIVAAGSLSLAWPASAQCLVQDAAQAALERELELIEALAVDPADSFKGPDGCVNMDILTSFDLSTLIPDLTGLLTDFLLRRDQRDHRGRADEGLPRDPERHRRVDRGGDLDGDELQLRLVGRAERGPHQRVDRSRVRQMRWRRLIALTFGAGLGLTIEARAQVFEPSMAAWFTGLQASISSIRVDTRQDSLGAEQGSVADANAAMGLAPA